MIPEGVKAQGLSVRAGPRQANPTPPPPLLYQATITLSGSEVGDSLLEGTCLYELGRKRKRKSP